ncbi:hypothetical protein HanRHA438_Chr11g0484551 [Helianthus annuus]|nr:hypothetical protein HanHA89_Chr11g0409221 [Helianthus annuus]KAJ0869018.1 hypothetical protein HanRHA438_Chr11g0484551 [Helianthus annuus]
MMLPDIGEAWGVDFSQFRGAKTYISKNFYTKVLFITLRVEKFGDTKVLFITLCVEKFGGTLRPCCRMLICLIPKR